MLLSYFTEEAYDKLINSVNENNEKYMTDEEWLNSFLGNGSYFRTSGTVDMHRFVPSYTPGKKSGSQKSREDLVNTRLMYEAFKELTPLQASNKYMWTYLCHTIPEYRKYITDRWLTDTRENTVRTRFFVTDSKSSLFDNALSRLWWYGYLTYDEDNRANPYALTEILLTNQTICTDFTDTRNSMNPVRARGVLYALKDYTDEFGSMGLIDKFRSLNKYLNMKAAVTVFDFLSQDEIYKMALERLKSSK